MWWLLKDGREKESEKMGVVWDDAKVNGAVERVQGNVGRGTVVTEAECLTVS